MKLISVLLMFFVASMSMAQTTVYETGQGTSDAWTGWTVNVSNVNNYSVLSNNIYSFTLNSSGTYSIELTRAFDINSQDLDFYLNTTTASSTITLSVSTDNVNWTTIGTSNTGSSLSLDQMVVPTINVGNQNFYAKIKMEGTIGSNTSFSISSYKINADLNNPYVAGIDETNDDTQITLYNNTVKVLTSQNDYQIAIYNLSGQLIHQEKNLQNFDLTNFPKGIYFVSYQNKVGLKKTIKIAK
jgi:hypothetical protein